MCDAKCMGKEKGVLYCRVLIGWMLTIPSVLKSSWPVAFAGILFKMVWRSSTSFLALIASTSCLAISAPGISPVDQKLYYYLKTHDSRQVCLWSPFTFDGHLLMLWKLLLVSYCVVLWVLFSVFWIFCFKSFGDRNICNTNKLPTWWNKIRNK